MNKYFSGVLLDERTDEAIEKDYLSIEVQGEGSQNWSSLKELRSYPIWHQDGSGACVAFTVAKMASIELKRQTEEWLDLSPAFIYQKRVNRGRSGMIVADAFEIARKHGTTLEALMKSQNLTDEQIDSLEETQFAKGIAKSLSDIINAYLYLPIDMGHIADAIENGHGVALLIYANFDEYNDVPQVKRTLNYLDAEVRHMVTAVDYYTHSEFGRVLVIEDSWGVGHGQGGRRLITEKFLSRRCITAVYFDHFEFDGFAMEMDEFKTPLAFSQQSDEVAKLQDFLKTQNFFPSNQQSTGYYGNITRQAVLNWQLKELDDEVEVRSLQGRHFGPKSIARANEIIRLKI